MTSPSDGTVGIGDLSRRTGASVRSLRYYEQHGLLRSTRTSAGHRRFGADAIETVRRIRMLLEGGLPLAIVAKIMPCFTEEGTRLQACVAAYLREHIDVVTNRVNVLDQQLDTVTRLQGLIVG